MARIKVIEHKEAGGRLLEIYDDIQKKRGKLAEVHKIQSLRPESIVKHMELYMEIMFTRSELSRADREMMAVIVSVSNGCKYCRLHHGEALNHYWKSWKRIGTLCEDYEKAGLTDKQLLLCRFSEILTKTPEKLNDDSPIIALKDAGYSDQAILDATLVVAYFNFVNRMVLALGVESSEEEVGGYKY
ncbi:MAG: peroxidase-related enzyme [Bacteroidales bacterium]|nr:peroxidase-related enzyme [Bacteroidales bacterium]MCF8397911.1 peroxidase-related enzyme [Bacteroidales bacterium]